MRKLYANMFLRENFTQNFFYDKLLRPIFYANLFDAKNFFTADGYAQFFRSERKNNRPTERTKQRTVRLQIIFTLWGLLAKHLSM